MSGKPGGTTRLVVGISYLDNTRMLYGDAQKAVGELIQAVKAVG